MGNSEGYFRECLNLFKGDLEEILEVFWKVFRRFGRVKLLLFDV